MCTLCVCNLCSFDNHKCTFNSYSEDYTVFYFRFDYSFSFCSTFILIPLLAKATFKILIYIFVLLLDNFFSLFLYVLYTVLSINL